MAPRAPESFNHFISRLKKALDAGQTVVRFGRYHYDHAVCVEGEVYRLRRLEVTDEEAEAYLKEHGAFMPEHAEEISKPRTLVMEYPSLDALAQDIRGMFPP